MATTKPKTKSKKKTSILKLNSKKGLNKWQAMIIVLIVAITGALILKFASASDSSTARWHGGSEIVVSWTLKYGYPISSSKFNLPGIHGRLYRTCFRGYVMYNSPIRAEVDMGPWPYYYPDSIAAVTRNTVAVTKDSSYTMNCSNPVRFYGVTGNRVTYIRLEKKSGPNVKVTNVYLQQYY